MEEGKKFIEESMEKEVRFFKNKNPYLEHVASS